MEAVNEDPLVAGDKAQEAKSSHRGHLQIGTKSLKLY